jgi:hypothetical protein
MYTNSYIFGSSGGRSMSQVKCKQVNILPGGTYSTLCDLAEKQLRKNTDPKIVYFIAGIPDICTLTRVSYKCNELSYHFSYEHKNVRIEIQPHCPGFY